MPPPLVSVVIPAYRAAAVLPRAVASVLDGGLPEQALEILVESDDGTDYAEAAALSGAVRVGVSGAVASGVGPARNRALERATGDWVVFLDADDWLAPGFLAEALALAEGHGAAMARLEVRLDGVTVFDLGRHGAVADFDLAARTGASLRPVVRRERAGRFRNALSQDVAHGLEVIGAHDGRLPLTRAAYVMELTVGSVTDAGDFADRVDAAYRDHIRAFRAGETVLPPDWAEAAARVFEAKIALNAAHAAEGGGRHYYEFAAAVAGERGSSSPDGLSSPGHEESRKA